MSGRIRYTEEFKREAVAACPPLHNPPRLTITSGHREGANLMTQQQIPFKLICPSAYPEGANQTDRHNSQKCLIRRYT